MSTTVSNSGAGSSGQANFSSGPTDPELDPQAAEKALEALNDPQLGSIKDVMQQFYDSYYGGPPSRSGGGGDYSKENWDYATKQSPPVKPWWQTYEPIAGFDDNCNTNADLWDQNAVNAPTVKLWACFFGVKTGYCDPSYEGPGPVFDKHQGEYYHDPMWNVQDSDVQDSVSKMIQALKGKIEIIDTNILGVSGDPSKVQKLNQLRCQVQTGLDAAIKLDNWRNQVIAWIGRAGLNNTYDMLKPDKYSGDYYRGHLSPSEGHFDRESDNASQREDYLYSTLKSGPNNSDPFPRPPFDPFELAITCYNSVNSLSNPW